MEQETFAQSPPVVTPLRHQVGVGIVSNKETRGQGPRAKFSFRGTQPRRR